MKRLTLVLLLLLLLTAQAEVLRCPECGYENETDYKHCIKCGAALPFEWELSGALCFPLHQDGAWPLAVLSLGDETSAPVVIYDDGGETARPRWREDTLYFASDASGGWGVYQLREGEVTRLDNGSESVFSPAPAEEGVAVISGWEICLLSEAGGLLPLTFTPTWESEAVWSPAGRLLVWVEELSLVLCEVNSGSCQVILFL